MSLAPCTSLQIQNVKNKVSDLKKSNAELVQSNIRLNEIVNMVSAKFKNAPTLLSVALLALNSRINTLSSTPFYFYVSDPKHKREKKGKVKKSRY